MELIEKETRLSATSLSVVIDSLVSLLRSVDSRMWTVNAPRYRWVIREIRMQSPLTMTLEAILTSPDAPMADVVGNTFKGLKLLDGGRARKRPKFFDEEGLALSKRMVSVYSDGVLAMNFRTPEREEISPSSRIAKTVERIIENSPLDPFDAYGSVEGVLRRVTVDDRPKHEVYDLQIIDRHTDQIVNCKVSSEMAEQLTQHLRKRVVLYGMIRYNGEHVPQRIKVESFEPISTEKLPTLEDLHELGINITNGEDAADYISRMRGDGD
ncbi:MAG TPA: hypothetical protein VG269_17135 [Tepidisphaeraceae bacterium]|nr:hypothetical protein [Tepidisphaeraceae bacterium]